MNRIDCRGLIVLALPMFGWADNPIIQTKYTADPAPMVYGDRFYIYTGHDEEVTLDGFYTMNDWNVYSSADMVNWTDHGTALSYQEFAWAQGDAWAAQAIERNGKFYYYAPSTAKDGGFAIGVGVSDSPTGPFKDALGEPLIPGGYDRIDPTVWIDDDGQAYLYFGWTNTYYVKLNADMISYSGNIEKVTPSNYVEGPWFYKRNGQYFLVYPSGNPECIAYSTSSNPGGPWTYKGVIMEAAGRSFTNQAGIVDFKGKSYFVYHTGALPGGDGFHRSVAIEEFRYNADGSIPTIPMSDLGPSPISNLDPFIRQEAETMAFSMGLKTKQDATIGVYVTAINDGDYIKLRSVNFGIAADRFKARVASESSGASIELHLDSPTGLLIGTLVVENTGGSTIWREQETPVSGVSGVHDLYFVFKGSGTGDLFHFDDWTFEAPPVSIQNRSSNQSRRITDVFRINGTKVRSPVERASALQGFLVRIPHR